MPPITSLALALRPPPARLVAQSVRPKIRLGNPCTPGLIPDARGVCVPDGRSVPTIGYRISRGDTLPVIADRLKVSTTAIVALNPGLGQRRRSWGTDFKVMPAVGQLIRVPRKVGPRSPGRALAGEMGFLGDIGDCCGFAYTRLPDGSCENDITGSINWDCGGGPTDGGDIDCGPGQKAVQGPGYVGCASELSGQPCGDGGDGTYNDYGVCTYPDGYKGGSSQADENGNDISTIIGNAIGADAYKAAQAGADPVAYANSLTQNEANVLCGLAAVASAVPIFVPFTWAACAAAQADVGSDNTGGNNSDYPQPCGTPNAGFYVYEPGGSCMFGGAGDACFPDGSDVPSMFDTQGNCVPKPSAQAGKTCATPNGYQGRAASDGVCLVDGCPAGKKPNDLATDCIAATAPGGTPAGGNPGTGPVKPGPGGAVVPVDKPSAGKKAEESNTGLYIAAAAAAAAAIAVGYSQSKKKKGKTAAKKR